MRHWLTFVGLTIGLLAHAAPAAAQGRGGGGGGGAKRYAITHDRAFNITKEVLGKHGFDVIRIEVKGGDRVIHYRRGNMGRGRGRGPMQTLIIRRVENRIEFVNVPDPVLVDIDIRLRF